MPLLPLIRDVLIALAEQQMFAGDNESHRDGLWKVAGGLFEDQERLP